MIQRVFEEHELTTVSISLVREHTEKIRPPRALFVPFPFGAPLGMPGDADQQHRVLRAALQLLDEPSGPVLRDFPEEEAGDGEAGPIQASAVEATPGNLDVATEVSMMRRYYEQWLEQQGKTAVGLTAIPPTRFRGIVRFLEALADDRPADMKERSSDLSLPDFVRHCADDLKALYLEGRMVMKPGESPDHAARWLWGETALGELLRRLRERLAASSDPAMKDAAFGIAR